MTDFAEIKTMLVDLISGLAAPDDTLLPAVAKMLDRMRSKLELAGFTRDEAIRIICTIQLGKR